MFHVYTFQGATCALQNAVYGDKYCSCAIQLMSNNKKLKVLLFMCAFVNFLKPATHLNFCSQITVLNFLTSGWSSGLQFARQYLPTWFLKCHFSTAKKTTTKFTFIQIQIKQPQRPTSTTTSRIFPEYSVRRSRTHRTTEGNRELLDKKEGGLARQTLALGSRTLHFAPTETIDREHIVRQRGTVYYYTKRTGLHKPF
jgi:hypothetical protein